MRKIPVIIAREYLTRVRSKAFILSTLLTPLFLIAVMILPILSMTTVEKERTHIFIEDPTGNLLPLLIAKSNDEFIFSPAEKTRAEYETSLQNGEVYLELSTSFTKEGDAGATLLVPSKISLQVKDGIHRRVKDAAMAYKLSQAGIDPAQFEQIRDFRVKLNEINLSDSGETSISTEVGTFVGYGMSFLIYFMLVFYGVFVMRGVIEEKTSRIVEVIVSSVKPFHLMMGKIIGIGAAGLTQFVIWIGLVLAGSLAIPLFFAVDPGTMPATPGAGDVDPEQIAEMTAMIEQVLAVLSFGNIALFLFYFLGGFFIYGTLFAAVGSAVDQESDAQQFQWPVTMLLIVPMMVIGNVMQNPSGTLAVVLSQVPFFSPIIMIMRITSAEVPWYEILSSMILLILGFMACVWVAAKVYRVGILLYGKKPSFGEIIKWIRHY